MNKEQLQQIVAELERKALRHGKERTKAANRGDIESAFDAEWHEGRESAFFEALSMLVGGIRTQ